jgi:hypothetical protein
MNEAENFKFKISTGNDELDSRPKSNFKILTLDEVYKIIESSTVDENTKTELKKKANNYPFNALKTFVKNLDKNISKIRNGKK